MIELPHQDPCEICEGIAGRDPLWTELDRSQLTITALNPWQFEKGQCCVITRRHVGTLLELTLAESAEVLSAAQRIAQALVRAYQPLGVLTFQNNGVYSGQLVPHFHFHVVPRQPGSDWGIGPPQLAVFDGVGRQPGTPHDSSGDAERRHRAKKTAAELLEIAHQIKAHLALTAP